MQFSTGFIAVAILMTAMIVLVVIMLLSLRTAAEIKIRTDMNRLISSYDRLIEEKSRQIEELQKNEQNLKKALSTADTVVVSVENTAESGYAAAQASIPDIAAYRTSGFAGSYGAIKDCFGVTPKEKNSIVDYVKKDNINIDFNYGIAARALREQFSFDLIFKLSQMGSEDQLGLLYSTLVDTDRTILLDYASISGTDDFSVNKFCDWLDSIALLGNPDIVVYGTDEQNQSENGLFEGIRVVVGNKLYDYSISEREIS